MRLDLAGIIGAAMQTLDDLGLTGALVLTTPPAVNGKTGAVTGSATQQTVRGVEMAPADIQQQPGESWQRATCGVFVEAAALVGVPALTWTATWAGRVYKVVAVQPMATTGAPLTYAIGLAV